MKIDDAGVSEKMTLEQVRDRIKHLEQSMESARITAAEFRQWSDAIESALVPRVVSMEGLVAMGRVIASNAGENWDNIGEFAQNIILDTQRSALEAFERNRK